MILNENSLSELKHPSSNKEILTMGEKTLVPRNITFVPRGSTFVLMVRGSTLQDNIVSFRQKNHGELSTEKLV